MGVRVVRSLPEGWKPEDFGFEVVKDRRATPAEVGQFYKEYKDESGLVIEALEKYLSAVDTSEAAGNTRRDDDGREAHSEEPSTLK